MRDRAITVLAVMVVGSALRAQTYVENQSTANDGGERLTSASYVLTGSVGQESTISASSSSTYVVQSGFWSFAGSEGVPIVLTAKRNPIDGADVDLEWSGNSSPYTVKRGTSPTTLTPYVTEPSKAYTDTSPPPVMLICYAIDGSVPTPQPAVSTRSRQEEHRAPKKVSLP